ncbi:MAG: hydrogenase maturation nickel metallochaperone HypA [Gammaproteobacteria bacterium]|nr:MAG: hydrogenase maturation nickel metallochaperone HypA [Gammaproteobacteria bacterium]
MHELSICQSLIRQVETLAKQHRARAIARVTVQIGPLSGVAPELLEQAFYAARAGTLAEAARLTTLHAPVRVRCEQCGAESAAAIQHLTCARCGGWRTQLISGNEMQLVSVELVGGDHAPSKQEETAYV